MPRRAPCPYHRTLTALRVCPHCRRDLPHYVGATSQSIVAVAGARGTGKTVFLWSLLHRIRQRLSANPDPPVVAMFEDDESFAGYADLAMAVIAGGELPEGTQAEGQKLDGLKPVIVRLLLRSQGWMTRPPVNLIFYDPAGELIESLEDVRYLRYLAYARGLIYLADATDASVAGEALSAEALSHLIRQVREQVGGDPNKPLPQTLALTLTKADAGLIQHYGLEPLIPPAPASESALAAASLQCEALLRDRGFDNMLNIAQRNFERVRCFAVSSLGATPDGGRLPGPPEPMGVENPLLWLLDQTA